MGLLDGVLGGIVGAEMANVINNVITQHGGLGAMVQQFQQQGLGNAVQSWIGTGPNQPITGDQLHQVLGSDMVSQLAAKFGMTPQEISAKLATVLPQAVDQMTPAGVIPAGQ